MEKLIKRVIVIGVIAIVAVILLFNCFTIGSMATQVKSLIL